MNDMDSFEWLLCPVCNSKTRIKLRLDTELKNFPLFCPKCKQETLISVFVYPIITHRPFPLCHEAAQAPL